MGFVVPPVNEEILDAVTLEKQTYSSDPLHVDHWKPQQNQHEQ